MSFSLKSKKFLKVIPHSSPLFTSLAAFFSLNILAKGASLRFLITRLFDWYNTPENSYVKRKDPQEYIDKLLYFNSNKLDFLYD